MSIRSRGKKLNRKKKVRAVETNKEDSLFDKKDVSEAADEKIVEPVKPKKEIVKPVPSPKEAKVDVVEEESADEMEEEKSHPLAKGSYIPSEAYLSNLNVHELRRLARGFDNFPIKGREISKANRQMLLDYFKELR
jgi:hypothetical protein